MALDTFNPYLFVSAGEQSNKFLTPTYADGIAHFQAQRAQSLTGLTVRIDAIQEGTGDPSPENIRPISGRIGLTATVQSGETQNEYPVTWESIAGTVYGGTLDVVSGVLTVGRASVDMGTLAWRYFASGDYFYVPVDGKALGNQNVISSIYATSSGSATTQMTDYQIKGHGTSNTVYVKDSRYTAAEDLITALSGQTMVYELATPQTYQLTPTDVRTLAGFNQVYSDAGPVIDIKF